MSPLLHHQNFGYLGYLVGPTPRACWFYKNIEKRQLWVRPMGGWNSSLQAAWYLRHAHWARLWFVPFVIWCLWIRSTIWMLILSSTSYMVGRSRVYVFPMKDIGRWLPWMLPGSTGRFYKDERDVVHNHSTHGSYITRIEGGVRYEWYCYVLKRTIQNWAKTAIHVILELDLVTFHMKFNLSDGTSKIDVGMITI